MTIDEFKPLASRVRAWWPSKASTWSPAVAAVWFQDLEPYPYPEVEQAFLALRRRPYIPSLGEVLAHLDRGQETPFSKAWPFVRRALSRHKPEGMALIEENCGPIVKSWVLNYGWDRLRGFNSNTDWGLRELKKDYDLHTKPEYAQTRAAMEGPRLRALKVLPRA